MKISDNGLKLIKELEGFRPKPYLDAVGVPTIGYGTTRYSDGTRVTMGDKPISEEEATEIMRVQIDETYADAVNRYITVPTTQNQFDALVSFAYNLGAGSLKKSTLLKHHNDKNYGLASYEFRRWNKAGGHVLNGLVKRRKAEEELYIKDDT